MITITKQNDGVLFTFENSDKYLYGSGSILVPFNTLSIVADESDMITLKKAASNDVFLSARYDTDFGYRSKDDAIDDLKGMLFAETGGGSESGITSGEVQTMIDNSLEDYYTDDEVDAALSGKASISDVTAVANDVQTVSGQVATKVAITDFNAYSAATATALGNKQDALQYYEENTEDGWAEMRVATDDGDGNTSDQHISIGGGATEMGNYQEYNHGQGNTGYTSTNIQFNNPEINMYAESEDNGETEITYFNITPTSVTINDERVLTEGDVDNALNSGSTNPVQNAVITQALNNKLDASAYTPTDLSQYWTSAQTQTAIDDAKAYYVDFAAMSVQGITDADWDGLVAAINAHRPILVKIGTYNSYVTATYSIISDNVITITGADGNYASTYTFTKNGSNDYSVSTSTKQFVTQAEKAAWNAKVDTSAITTAITSGSTDAEIPTAKAVYDATQSGGGGMDDDTQQLISTAFNDLNDRKADLTELTKYQKKGDYVETSTLADYMTNDAFDEYATAKERIISGALNDLNDKFGGLKLVKISQTDYDNLATKDSSTLYIISD